MIGYDAIIQASTEVTENDLLSIGTDKSISVKPTRNPFKHFILSLSD
jgi:hypothetical protein